MPSECFTVNYLGARAAAAGIWQQAFPLGGHSQRAGGSLSTGTPAQSQGTQNGESPTQQLQSREASPPLTGSLQGRGVQHTKTRVFSNLSWGKWETEGSKAEVGEGVVAWSAGDWDRKATTPVYGTQTSDPEGLLMVL